MVREANFRQPHRDGLGCQLDGLATRVAAERRVQVIIGG